MGVDLCPPRISGMAQNEHAKRHRMELIINVALNIYAQAVAKELAEPGENDLGRLRWLASESLKAGKAMVSVLSEGDEP